MAPAGWAVVSIAILLAHKRRGHGVKLFFPITTAAAGTLSAVLYVDDTDVIHLNMAKEDEVEVTHEYLQNSIWVWGQLLQATGGLLKGSKFFFHLIPSASRQMGHGTTRRMKMRKTFILEFQQRGKERN